MIEWGALEVTLLPLLLALLISSTALAQPPAGPSSAPASLSASQSAAQPSFFTYAEGVSFSHRKVMEEDQVWLRMRRNLGSSDLQRILSVDAVTAQNLRTWLSERVKLILSPDWSALSNWEMLEESVTYPGSVKKFEMNASDGFWALNVGSALYQFGKIRSALIGAAVPGVTAPIPVRSPRVGLVQLGEHFFRSQGGEAADRIFRLQVLFHEGRHSDGRGASLGFPHSTCPLESDYPGQTLCDASRNGPYSVDAALNSALAESCKECTAAGRDFLRLFAADSLSRVISFWKKEEYACNEITCRVTIVEAEDTTDWDATPEFLD